MSFLCSSSSSPYYTTICVFKLEDQRESTWILYHEYLAKYSFDLIISRVDQTIVTSPFSIYLRPTQYSLPQFFEYFCSWTITNSVHSNDLPCLLFSSNISCLILWEKPFEIYIYIYQQWYFWKIKKYKLFVAKVTIIFVYIIEMFQHQIQYLRLRPVASIRMLLLLRGIGASRFPWLGLHRRWQCVHVCYYWFSIINYLFRWIMSA